MRRVSGFNTLLYLLISLGDSAYDLCVARRKYVWWIRCFIPSFLFNDFFWHHHVYEVRKSNRVRFCFTDYHLRIIYVVMLFSSRACQYTVLTYERRFNENARNSIFVSSIHSLLSFHDSKLNKHLFISPTDCRYQHMLQYRSIVSTDQGSDSVSCTF